MLKALPQRWPWVDEVTKPVVPMSTVVQPIVNLFKVATVPQIFHFWATPNT